MIPIGYDGTEIARESVMTSFSLQEEAHKDPKISQVGFSLSGVYIVLLQAIFPFVARHFYFSKFQQLYLAFVYPFVAIGAY